METEGILEVPAFGAVVERQRLLAVLLGQQLGMTLVSAPAGHGKSVLASQFARAGDFHRVLWLSAFDEDMCGERIVVSVAAALAGGGWTDAADHIGPPSIADALLSVDAALQGKAGHRLCIIVDGCNRVEDLSCVEECIRLIRRLTSSSSALLVTCRNIGDGCVSLDPGQSCALDAQDLRFTDDEVLQLVKASAGGRDCAELAKRLRDRFEGHPALTSLMLRHCDLDDEISPPRDLVWYSDRLTAQLSAPALRLLYVASLLKEDDWATLCGLFEDMQQAQRWEELESLSPLVSLGEVSGATARRFRIHEVVRDSINRRAYSALSADDIASLRAIVLQHLESVADYRRIQCILQDICPEAEVAEWSERCGSQMLRTLGVEAVTRVMDRMSPAVLSSNPRLLLLRSAVLGERERYEEARSSALLASNIAEATGDFELASRALLTAARLDIDACDFHNAARLLARLDRSAALPSTLEYMADALLAEVEAQMGQIPSAILRAERLLPRIRTNLDLTSDAAAVICNAVAGVSGVCAGRWDEAATLLAALGSRQDLAPSKRALILANLAACQTELASLSEAEVTLDAVIRDSETAGLRHLIAFAKGTRAAVRWGQGDLEGGFADHREANGLLASLGHEDAGNSEKLSAAVGLRAFGRLEQALALTETLDRAMRDANTPVHHLTQVEHAASLLSMGDDLAAQRIARAVLARLSGGSENALLLRALLVEAECNRRQSSLAEAVQTLAKGGNYLQTGSANWLTAMYIRAFPGLLGVLAEALGAENIPLRMLLMIPIETIEQACEIEGGLCSEDGEVLRRRGGNDLLRLTPVPQPVVGTPTFTSNHACYVRLFGGLEVTTKDGIVDDARWRKRKARLVFAILVLRQHQDVPRDVLLEHLWPDMDEQHAKRNFYVTWSTMKRALACGGPPSAARQYVQCTGGVCRATRDVRSDVDDFDETLVALRTASGAGDTEATLSAAHRLVDLYRGELLPGDLYEEWFTDVRERTKHDFCDAMMCAATAAEDAGDSETALFLLRRAALADPWREDVYQSTMRCQMHAGQRSRAIETYMSCRSRLTEDLGIDPSVETTRIYQSVLAMEEAVDATSEYSAE